MATATQTLPTTLAEILAVAAPHFEDPTTHSVNIEASWGPCHAFPDGTVKWGHLIDDVLYVPKGGISELIKHANQPTA